jgi:opacity protein-like surface antigen
MFALFLSAAVAATSSPALADVTISPRFSYYFDNVNQRTSGFDEALRENAEQQSDEFTDTFGPGSSQTFGVESAGIEGNALAIPMYGLSATVGSDDLSVTLTGMYGKTDSSSSATIGSKLVTVLNGITATDIGLSVGSTEIKAKRYDLEASVQKRLNERFALVGGVRYERVKAISDTLITTTLSNNFVNLISTQAGGDVGFEALPALSFLRSKTTSELYGARVGISGFIPFSQSATVFVNGMIHASHRPATKSRDTEVDVEGEVTQSTDSEEKETSIGPDIAVGIQVGLTENIAFDARYRAVVFFPVSGALDFTDPRVNHGVNLGVSYRF